MAESDTEGESAAAGRAQAILERLTEAGWLLGGAAALTVLFYLIGGLSLEAGLLLFAGFAALVALVPRGASRDRPVHRSEPPRVKWPETGLKLFAEALPDPCFILDLRGVVRYANQRAIEAFSIRIGDLLTSRLRVPDLVSAFDRVAKGGSSRRVEFFERVPTERWFAAWFARLDARDRDGQFVALILDDMTERRRSERIRADFVANASHELRTPLASLAGFIETLQGPARDDPHARERFLKIMRDQTTRMSRLVDDLLSLSRIEMKAHVRPSDKIDLLGTVKHVSDALEPHAGELGVEIAAALPDAQIEVVGDRDELIQVFENLIENACKYGQSGGRVEVTASPAAGGNGPSVAVRDYGPGIAEEHVPRLTERFYRIDAEDGRKHRGTGLGLAIVKHILARHQARLAISSRLGEGATFTVFFPQASVPVDAEPGKIVKPEQEVSPS